MARVNTMVVDESGGAGGTTLGKWEDFTMKRTLNPVHRETQREGQDKGKSRKCSMPKG